MATVSRGSKSEKFEFIHRHGKELGVSYLCEWLKVSTSGYYAWRKRPESKHAQEDTKLIKKIVRIYQDSEERYGSPRVFKALKKQGIAIGKKRVERLMQALNIQGRVVRVTRQATWIKALQGKW